MSVKKAVLILYPTEDAALEGYNNWSIEGKQVGSESDGKIIVHFKNLPMPRTDLLSVYNKDAQYKLSSDMFLYRNLKSFKRIFRTGVERVSS